MTSGKPLRLWPAVVIAIIQLIVMIGAPLVGSGDGVAIGMLGGIAETCPSPCTTWCLMRQPSRVLTTRLSDRPVPWPNTMPGLPWFWVMVT